jgi:hypothetical protein
LISRCVDAYLVNVPKHKTDWNNMGRFSSLSIIAGVLLTACSTNTESDKILEESDSGYTLYAHAMFAEPVFDKDVLSLTKAFSKRLGTPRSTAKFGYTSNLLKRPSPENVNNAIAKVSSHARDGDDVVIVFLTTHGTEGLLAVKPSENEQATGVSADALRDFLKPAQNDQQIIILQACYSGSLIKGLKHPNRIIITAAAADKTSFGCSPGSRNTWFTKAMVAALPKANSWSDVFANTKSKVLEYEAQQGIPKSDQSNPQHFVGRNMKNVWTQDF